MGDERYRAYLRERYRALCGYVGVLFILIGLIILAPAGLVLFFPAEKHIAAGFLWPGLGLTLLGIALRIFLEPKQKGILSIAEGAAIVFVAWCAAIFIGAIPFHWAGLDMTRAVFEATSGWTTTGLSVVNVEVVSPLLLFFRSLMQLAGGAGLAILMISAMAGPAGVGLTTAEGRTEQLVPQIGQSARLVVTLYCFYTVLGVAALKLAGMDWFNAVNHAFCAVSTGGFSTRPESIGFWDSPAIEAVLIVLMLLGSVNFLTAYTLLRGQWRAVLRNGELGVMAVMLPAATLLLFWGVTFIAGKETSNQIRAAIFQAVAALSTTGYSTVSFPDWNSLGWMIIIILMLIGGGAGSTAGGMKQHRIFLLFKGLKRDLAEVFRPPKAVYEEIVWSGNQQRLLTESDLRRAGSYIALYLLIWLAGGCAISAFGHPLADSLFEFASSLGTVGLSVGVTSSEAADGQLWIQIVGMLLGRLEFFVIFWGMIKVGADLIIAADRF